MGNIITEEVFFDKAKEEIIADKKIKNKELIIKSLENKTLNVYFEDCSDTREIIPTLQKINEYFIKKCEIHIDEGLIIIPIETEIYFANNYFYDGMCHMNPKQKNNFGHLYFHRLKNDNTINVGRGGVDVCISPKNATYHLSILIRSAIVNEEFFSGIKNIVDAICDSKGIKDKQKQLKTIEEKQEVLLYKTEKQINPKNIFSQQRIVGKYYASEVGKCIEYYKLNCLNYDFLNNIIEKKQTFYKVSDNIKRIKKDFEEQRKTMKQS